MYKIQKCKDKESEYSFATEYLKKIHNVMIKADCIKWLAKRWGQDEAELKAFFNAKTEDVEELLSNVNKVEDCVASLDKLYERGQFRLVSQV